MIYTKSNIIRGGLIYSIGDSLAAIMQGDFTFFRFICVMILGATLYAIEIPNYFAWIEKKTTSLTKGKGLIKMSLALIYFNPLWIARHLFFINLFSFKMHLLNWNLFYIALLSFVVNIPISLIANYVIQNKISLDWRFLASAIFSGLMAIYYALSQNWFS